MATDIVKFTDDGGKPVQFTAQDVKQYVCTNATDKEVALFLAHCAKHNLDPIGAKDAYLVKYGSGPAQIITGFQVFNRRANKAKDYAGIEDGVVVWSQQRGVERRPGSAVYKELGERLIGGWARVSFNNGKVPAYAEVALADFDTGKSNWAKMPGVMIDKVAKSTAWRLAYPDEFGGMYSREEMDQAIDGTPKTKRKPKRTPKPKPVQQAVVEPQPAQQQAQPAQAQPQQPAKQQLPPEWKAFMRSESARLAQATGTDANTAAHRIIEACGQPVSTAQYGKAVQDFVTRAANVAAQVAANKAAQAQQGQPVYATPPQQQAQPQAEAADEGEWEDA